MEHSTHPMQQSSAAPSQGTQPITHYRQWIHPGGGAVSQEITSCITACYECAEACKSCADACLGEAMVQDLVRCIRLDLDCAEICVVTGDLLLRQTDLNEPVVHDQLQACITACQRCEAECRNHAEAMEHCRICAEACRNCALTCKALFG